MVTTLLNHHTQQLEWIERNEEILQRKAMETRQRVCERERESRYRVVSRKSALFLLVDVSHQFFDTLIHVIQLGIHLRGDLVPDEAERNQEKEGKERD